MVYFANLSCLLRRLMAIFPGRAASSILAPIKDERYVIESRFKAAVAYICSINFSSGGFTVPTILVLPFVFSPFLIVSLMILASGRS